MCPKMFYYQKFATYPRIAILERFDKKNPLGINLCIILPSYRILTTIEHKLFLLDLQLIPSEMRIQLTLDV